MGEMQRETPPLVEGDGVLTEDGPCQATLHLTRPDYPDADNPATDRIEELRLGKVVLGYLKHNRRSFKPTYHQTLHRFSQVEILLRHRYGSELPKTDDIEEIIRPIAALFWVEHRARGGIFGDEQEAKAGFGCWLERWAPWGHPTMLGDIWSEVQWARYRPKADTLARQLRVTLAERTALGLTQIGAYDVIPKERKAIAEEVKRAKDREAKKTKRRAAGVLPRADYEANSIEAQKPWVAAGISRPTWYRNRRKQKKAKAAPNQEHPIETGVSRVCLDRCSLPTDLSHTETFSAAGANQIQKTDGGQGYDARESCKRSAAGPKGGRSPSSPEPQRKTDAA